LNSTRDAYPPFIIGVLREATSSTTGIELSPSSEGGDSIVSDGHAGPLGLDQSWQLMKDPFGGN